MQNVAIYYFLLGQFIEIVLVKFVAIVFVFFVTIVFVFLVDNLTKSSYLVTEVSSKRLKYLLFSQIHVLLLQL